MNTWYITFWNLDGVCFNRKGMTFHWQCPKGMLEVVLNMSTSFMETYQNPDFITNLENIFSPTILDMRFPLCGIGYVSSTETFLSWVIIYN